MCMGVDSFCYKKCLHSMKTGIVIAIGSQIPMFQLHHFVRLG